MKTLWTFVILIGLSIGASHAQNNNPDPKAAARFQGYDLDNDGSVSRLEFSKSRLAERGESPDELDRRFKDMDRNRDNLLSLAEYANAKRERDWKRGKESPPEKPDRRRPATPELVTIQNPDGTITGEWGSPLLKKAVPCSVLLPNLAAADYPVVVYLKGLNSPRLGTVDDETLIQEFLDQGMMVIEADYGGDRRARAPELLPEIDHWYGFLNETPDYPVDSSWIYIIPAGHTIDRNVWICDIPGQSIEMDVFYPSGNAAPVPLMLQITSIKDDGFWINQRAYYLYGMLTHGYAGAVMEHNGGQVVSPKGDIFPEKRAARLFRAEAARWNLSGKLGVTGHSKGSSRAAKAAFLNEGEREADPGPHGDQSDRFQASLLSAGQHATEFLLEDGYLDEVGPDKRAAAEKQFAAMTLEEMLEISTTTYVTPDDPPAFLCVGERDKSFRVAQMTRLANKCRQVGVPHQFVIQPDMPHQYIDDPEVIGRIFSFLDRYLK